MTVGPRPPELRPPEPHPPEPRPTGERAVGIVVITHNRAAELAATLDRLAVLPDRGPIVVVDNASSDGTGQLLERRRDVTAIRSEHNLGAAARTLGAAALRTRYVAFCDDDAWWTPWSLDRAAHHLDRCAEVAAVCAAVAVVPAEGAVRLDDTSRVMAHSPLPARAGQPGPRLVGLLAAATVIRRNLFLAVGGFDRRFGVGGEETLLALDLLDAGWDLCFAPDCLLVHQPSRYRVPSRTRRIGEARNRLLTAWLRAPRRHLPGATLRALLAEPGVAPAGLLAAARLLPEVLADRRPVRREVVDARRTVDRAERHRSRQSRAIAGPGAGVRLAGNRSRGRRRPRGRRVAESTADPGEASRYGHGTTFGKVTGSRWRSHRECTDATRR